jgi:hypothetical protein
VRVRPYSATDTSACAKVTRPNIILFFSTSMSAMELLGAGYCPTRRGLTLGPARAGPFWIKRGACLLHDLEEVGKRGKELYQKNHKDACVQVRPYSVTDTSACAKVTRPNIILFFSASMSAMELLGAGYCPTRRGWTLFPARARPFWIKRGACPLHDLEEV